MYGHFWACEPCWKAVIDAGVRDFYLLKNAVQIFTKEKVYGKTLALRVKTGYISGPLTHLPEHEHGPMRELYERLAGVCSELGCRAYVPHLHMDPRDGTNWDPGEVWRKDVEQVRGADVTIAEVTFPSLERAERLCMRSGTNVRWSCSWERGSSIAFRQAETSLSITSNTNRSTKRVGC